MLQGEHSAILLTFIKLPFAIKIFALTVFEWPFYKGFTVHVLGNKIHTFILSQWSFKVGYILSQFSAVFTTYITLSCISRNLKFFFLCKPCNIFHVVHKAAAERIDNKFQIPYF